MGKITFGERAINWAKAIAIIVPLLGIGAVGGIKVPEIWHEYNLAEVDGKTEVELTNFQKSVKKFSEEMREEIERIDLQNSLTIAKIDKIVSILSKKDRSNYGKLTENLSKLTERLNTLENRTTIVEGLCN